MKECLHPAFSKSRLLPIFLLLHFSLFAQVKEPVPSFKEGKYEKPIDLILTSETPNSSIHYTLDGNEPDSNSQQFTSPLLINKTTTLRYKAYAQGLKSSKIGTKTYFFDTKHTVPIVALSFKPAHFFDTLIGIYPNHTQDIEVPAHFAFFETAKDTSVVALDLGTEIQGVGTTGLPQKSLELKAKAAYGTPSVLYPIFADLPYVDYKRVVLRNSGQDWGVTMFRDQMASSLMTDFSDVNGIITKPQIWASSYRPAVVYYNGAYWGIHNMCERMKTSYVEQHFNLKSKDYVLVENEKEALNGDSSLWFPTLSFLRNNAFNTTASYDSLNKHFDLANVLDYITFNVFIDNQDWLGNNNRRFKLLNNGKWRWLTYDLDFSFGLFQSTGGWNTGDATPNTLKRLMEPDRTRLPEWASLPFERCLQNPKFRRDFINRMADMMNTLLTSDRINKRIDDIKAVYQPEMAQHVARWGVPWGSDWDKNVNKMKAFASNRPAEVYKHINEQFAEVTDTASVTLKVSPAVGGHLKLNTLTIKDSEWKGIYFKGVDIPIEAVAAEGYVFVGWSDAAMTQNAVNSINLNGAKTLTAVFKLAVDPCLTDKTSPTFQNCPTNIILTTKDTCAVATWTAPTAQDNCKMDTIMSSHSSGTCFLLGTTQVGYLAKDTSGNVATCSFNIIVNAYVDPCSVDTIEPTFQNCPQHIVTSTKDTCTVVTWDNITAQDNCEMGSTLSNFTSGTCFPVGTTQVVYTANDASGNKSMCRFDVIVSAFVDPCATDTIVPVFQNCPTGYVVTATSEACVPVSWGQLNVTDNCSSAGIVSAFGLTGDCFSVGETVVQIDAFDRKGNSNACVFKVLVKPVPQGDCKRFSVKDVNNICGCGQSVWAPYSIVLDESGKCFGAPLKAQNVTFEAYNDGTARLKGDFRDAKWKLITLDVSLSGKTKNGTPKQLYCMANKPVPAWEYYTNMIGSYKSGSDPVQTIRLAPNQVFQIGEGGSQQVATGLGANARFILNNDTLKMGSINIQLKDEQVIACSNVNPCDQDKIAPVFQNCPTNIVLTTTDTCKIATWTAPTATDNCSTTPSVLSNFSSGFCFPIGTTNVGYSAKDASGNIAICSFSVTIEQAINPCENDKVAPVFQNCPTNIVLTTTDTCKIATWTAPTATDNCTTTPSVIGSHTSGTCFPLGRTNIGYSAKDDMGNQGICSFSVTINQAINPCDTDKIAPVFLNCPTNIVLTTTDTCKIATWTAPTVTDNCATTPSVFSNFSSGFCFPIGITNVIYTAADDAGNQANCAFSVTVNKENINESDDIALSISANVSTYTRWKTIKFNIGAQNKGTKVYNNVKIEFKFPQGTVNGGTALPSVGTWKEWCAGAIQCFEWTIPTLVANSTATLEVPLFVKNINTPIVSTARLLSSTTVDNNIANNTATITIEPANALALVGKTSSAITIQRVAPVPVQTELTVDLESKTDGDAQFFIVDVSGRIVKTIPARLSLGDNRLIFDVRDLVKGYYVILPNTSVSTDAPMRFVKM
jgi:hypothetical protein